MLALHRACDGKPGLEGTRELSGQAFAALAIIDDARAAKREEDLQNGSG